MSDLPNCPECGHNKEVAIVEGLADTYDGVLYRVCCRACGGDWTWEYKLQPPNTKGGFLAARGLFADTWDGEPAEVTIRRLRDSY